MKIILFINKKLLEIYFLFHLLKFKYKIMIIINILCKSTNLLYFIIIFLNYKFFLFFFL